MLFILNNIIKNNILKIVVDNYTLFKDTNEYNMILNKNITNNINSIEYEEILNTKILKIMNNYCASILLYNQSNPSIIPSLCNADEG